MNIFHSLKSNNKHLLHETPPRLSDKKFGLRRYFMIYTALFALMCLVVFCWYFIPGRTFIWFSDGCRQHYTALIYYAQYMRNILRELLFNHRFVFPEWGFAFGEGNDILQSLHYYVIGDPFSVLSVFVPTRFLWLYYDFMILLRLYLAGIAFSCLCFYTRKNTGKTAVMAGTLSYVFCYWAIFNTARHPYFLNPMLYFPLIILGIEKILHKEKPYLLIFSVFLAAISNFYYFYVIVLLTIIYVAVRLLTKYKTDFKSMGQALLRVFGGSVLGTVMGGIILLPVLFDFMNDARMTSGNTWHLVYPLSYYSALPGVVFGSDKSLKYWLCMGYASPVILAVFLLLMRKKSHSFLKICLAACAVIILVPAFGQFFNGMSYMSNKWSWALALLSSYIFTVMWPELMNLKPKDALKLALILSIFFFSLLMLEYSRTIEAFAAIGIAFIFLIAIFPMQSETQEKNLLIKHRQKIALLLVMVAIVNVSFFKNSFAEGNYANESKEVEEISQKFMQTEVKAVKSVAASEDVSEFYRYSGRNSTWNSGTLYDISGTNYYWSISNPAVSEFRRTTEQLEPMPQNHIGYDDRTALLALSAVRYFVVPGNKNTSIPYGFTYVDSFNVKSSITDEAKNLLCDELGVEELTDAQIKVIEDATASRYAIYRNENVLPLAYTYDTIISENKWDTLSAVQKQEAMLQSVMLSGYDGETQDDAVKCSSLSPEYSIICNDTGVTLEDYGFVVTSPKSSVTLSFEGLANSETYFSIRGLDFDGVSTYDLYFGDDKYDPQNLFSKTRWDLLPYSEQESVRKNHRFWTEPTTTTLTLKSSSGVSKKLSYFLKDYNYYNDRHDFTANLNYAEEPVTSITITFSSIGIYSFDSIEITCQPMDGYVNQVTFLKESVLKNVDIGTDTICGSISLDEPQVLCLSVPYSVGWTAYVDGEKATIYQANIKNMALMLDAGEHEVALVYHTPYLRFGAVLSVIGFVGFFAMLLIDKSRKRKSNTAKRR